MSKNALGSRPSFNNVAKATGDLALDIDFNSDLEEKKSNPLLEDADNEEEAKRKFKEQRQEEAERKIKEELKEQLEEIKEEALEDAIEVQEQKTNKGQKKEKPKNNSNSNNNKQDDKPTTKKHLAEGYTRATFAVRDDHLELIKALASYKSIEQKTLLEALLEDALGSIKDQVKEEALATYKDNKKGSKTVRDIFK